MLHIDSMPGPDEKRRNKRLSVGFSAEDRANLLRAACADGRSESEIVCRAVRHWFESGDGRRYAPSEKRSEK